MHCKFLIARVVTLLIILAEIFPVAEAVTFRSFQKCLPTGHQQVITTSQSVRCPCFLSYGLNSPSRAPPDLTFDFLLVRSEEYKKWDQRGRNDMPAYEQTVSGLDMAATVFDNAANNGEGAYVLRVDQMEFPNNGEYLLVFRSSSARRECATTITYVLEPIPKPCPDRLPKSNRLQNVKMLHESNSNSAAKFHSRTYFGNDDKIVAGTPVTEAKDRAYMALVLGSQNDCSGSILSDRWILTAAHCAEWHEDAPVLVTGADTSSGTQYRTKRVVMHPKYKPDPTSGFTTFDIALIELDEPITEQFTPMAVNTDIDGPSPGQFLRASGYGYISQDWVGDPGQPRELRRVDIPLISTRDCVDALKAVGAASAGESLRGTVQLCAGYDAGDCGGDTCTGDSGGPVVAQLASDDGRFVQIGVTSAGIGCGRPRYPGIYTRVAPFVNWMESVTGPRVLKKASVGGRDPSIRSNGDANPDEKSRTSKTKKILIGCLVSAALIALAGVALVCLLRDKDQASESSDDLTSEKKNQTDCAGSECWPNVFRGSDGETNDCTRDCELGLQGEGTFYPAGFTEEESNDLPDCRFENESGFSSLANSLLRNPLVTIVRRWSSFPMVSSHDTESEMEEISSIVQVDEMQSNRAENRSNLARKARSELLEEARGSRIREHFGAEPSSDCSSENLPDLLPPSSPHSAIDMSSDVHIDLIAERPAMPCLGIEPLHEQNMQVGTELQELRLSKERPTLSSPSLPSSSPSSPLPPPPPGPRLPLESSDTTSETFYSLSSHNANVHADGSATNVQHC